ncbi:MerC domain-containing protein [Echinimonas agarilytica]|uniref:MerC domain-containing protein n=1 Tax=Echinimonas agarilytica TaxID=1215918 RepID=A0AA41W908_9GAMM|nr:MerC domain-containing protein [Echinimonas agarilytica]MCM2680354.1 MerC domain-containing protein [Echinimonas agarilytica]
MSSKVQTLDGIAIGISFLCVLHCALLPIALTVLPALTGTLFADESFHQALVVGIVPTSAIALLMGCRKHGHWTVLSWGLAGLTCLLLALWVGHDIFGEFGEKGLTLLGSFLVAIGHLKNFRSCRAEQCQKA